MPPVVFLAIAAGAAGLASVASIAGVVIIGSLTVGSILVNLAISFALTGILGLIAGASSQRPAQQQQNVKQPIPPRRRTYGRVKVGGVYAFLNNRKSNLYVVLMITQGEIDAFEQHYLGSDLLTVSGGGDVTVPAQYVLGSTSYVNIVGYLGSDSQTADSVLTTAWSDVLDSNFRLRGIAYSRLRLLSPKPEDFTKVYPAGLQDYNAVIRGAKVWDPRDPDQDPDDATTWLWTQNAALIFMDYLWNDDGMRLPRAQIQAAVDTWKLQADACDANRTLLDTSTEAWYRLSGQYQLTDPPKQVLPLMLDPIDGRLGLRPDGAIILDVGQWQSPDTTIQDRDVYSYSMTRGRQQADVRNEIRAQYVAPENNYIAAEAEPYQNTDSINVDGLQSMTMDLSWAPSHAQARYRMKIELARHDAQRWNGQVISNAYGLKFLCPRGDGTRKRTIHLAIAELGIDDDFEVQQFGVDLKTGRCTFSVTQMGADDYSWDAATDEGTAPVTGGIPDADTVEVPSDLTSTVDDATITGGLVVKFISATVDAATQANLSLNLAYRVHDGGVTDADAVWTPFTLDGDLIGHTGTLPDGGVYDVRARFINPQGQLSADVFDRSVTIGYSGSLPPVAAGAFLASENLAAGDLVNFHTVTGAFRVQKANATDLTKPAHGFVKAAVTSGSSGTVYGPGQINDAVSGLTPGSEYYLSTTGGAVVATPPTAAGNLAQDVGEALSATSLLFDPEIMTLRVVQIQVTDPAGSAISTGDGKAYFRVNAQLNGYNLSSVAAALTTVSSSGIPTIQIANVTDAVDMLSTKLTIDATETDSSTAATSAVIDATNANVATGDMLRIDIDVAGTGAKGLIVELTFIKP